MAVDSIKEFFRQQIELYGDELVLSPQGSSNDYTQDDGVDPGWESSDDLMSLYEKINRCVSCALGKSRTNFVFGSGNPHAAVMLIGDAPDTEEDRQGFPFVGQAGQLLDKILQAIHLDRTRVYLCNVVKCHPSQNRTPLLSELQTCCPFLHKQIAIVKPNIILCMGEQSAKTLLQSNEPIEKLRGRLHQRGQNKIIVTYHPSFLLQVPKYKRDTWFDVQLLEKQLEKTYG
jgi:uracil-DNA glycosylase